jgi:hypothetical protein
MTNDEWVEALGVCFQATVMGRSILPGVPVCTYGAVAQKGGRSIASDGGFFHGRYNREPRMTA